LRRAKFYGAFEPGKDWLHCRQIDFQREQPIRSSESGRGYQDSVLAQGLNALGIRAHAGPDGADRLVVPKPRSPRGEGASGKLLGELARLELFCGMCDEAVAGIRKSAIDPHWHRQHRVRAVQRAISDPQAAGTGKGCVGAKFTASEQSSDHQRFER
jgi:hypothetical protein